MHKDQKRVMDVALPAIATRLHDDSPEAQRDCTVLNRLLIQGPDPLYLMESTPGWMFADLCTGLELDVDVGRDAIEKAHWQGPGVLLGNGKGMPTEGIADGDIVTDWRREALWLVLASMSDCTEEGYSEETTLRDRIKRANAAVAKLAYHLAKGDDLWALALKSLEKFNATTAFEVDAKGIPHATEDHAFYVLYKQGYKCVAVHTDGGPIFYGTTPDSSLAAWGVEVDKELSPQFGLVFPK